MYPVYTAITSVSKLLPPDITVDKGQHGKKGTPSDKKSISGPRLNFVHMCEDIV